MTPQGNQGFASIHQVKNSQFWTPIYFNGAVDVHPFAVIGALSVKDLTNILEFPDIRYDQTLDNL